MKDSLTRLKYFISVASEWLEASGRPAEISAITQNTAGKTKRELKALETGLKVTSRRDFFLALVGKGKPRSERTPERTQSFTNTLSNEREDSLLADWQKRLAEAYPENMIEAYGQPAYWPTIKKSKDCANCGMCSAVCPTKTLQIVVNEGSSSHYFTSGLCIDCRVCQLFCPREGISRDREKVERPFEPTLLLSGSVNSCERCNSVTIANTNRLCFWCSEEVKTDHDFMNACRKLFLK
ncbi:MAG: 4Fe-4S dicluster domain-containing protein [Desulfitobacterium hafniense]|nr:4Fe-4S dicluster domain-containing protein [Desulfitobacterium hafniense]MEA5025598.1 4Fe-4S dicluster domain-containing protein [Desulfitobacterium hafniense]